MRYSLKLILGRLEPFRSVATDCRAMAVVMSSQILQVSGLSRPVQCRRQVSRLVVKGPKLQEQQAQPVRFG